MLISHTRQFIFLEVPRTASRAMGKALLQVVGNNFEQLAHHSFEIPVGLENYFTFACVRNPYSREVSHFLYRGRNQSNNMFQYASKWNFDEYTEWSTDVTKEPVETHDFPQATLLAGKKIDMILRFESLPEDFYRLPFITRKIKFLKINDNPPVDWHNYYSELIANRVYEWSINDFKEYGYNQNSWKNIQVAKKSSIVIKKFVYKIQHLRRLLV